MKKLIVYLRFETDMLKVMGWCCKTGLGFTFNPETITPSLRFDNVTNEEVDDILKQYLPQLGVKFSYFVG
jgi:hypothetical protein